MAGVAVGAVAAAVVTGAVFLRGLSSRLGAPPVSLGPEYSL